MSSDGCVLCHVKLTRDHKDNRCTATLLLMIYVNSKQGIIAINKINWPKWISTDEFSMSPVK